MLFIALSVLVALAALAAVAYPFLQNTRRAGPATTSAQETLEELLSQRDAAFQALRDLHFDHGVGKMTDEDATAFEAGLRQAAADALRALDDWEAALDTDLAPLLNGQLLAPQASLRNGQPCPNCGRIIAAGDRFCSGCGATVPAAPATPPAAGFCPQCGRQIETGDRFCAACGHPLPELAARA